MPARKRPGDGEPRGANAVNKTNQQGHRSRVVAAIEALDNFRSNGGSSTPATLFDARAEADEAIERVADRWRGDVLDELERAVGRLIARTDGFSADDVRDEVGDRVAGADLRCVGALLRARARAGETEAGPYVPSRYRNGSPIIWWKVVQP